MKGTNMFYLLCIIISTVVCIAIYGIYFDSLSETTMMQIAYGWIFLLVVGITGLIFRNNRKRVMISVISGVVALLLLIVFYQTIWPSL